VSKYSYKEVLTCLLLLHQLGLPPLHQQSAWPSAWGLSALALALRMQAWHQLPGCCLPCLLLLLPALQQRKQI
jgi:hypothetical protein